MKYKKSDIQSMTDEEIIIALDGLTSSKIYEVNNGRTGMVTVKTKKNETWLIMELQKRFNMDAKILLDGLNR